jgi:hypothetical protein
MKKLILKKIIPALLIFYINSSYSASVLREQMLCFEDRLSDFGVDVDYDVNDVCISCRMMFDSTGGAGGSMSSISVLCTPITVGAADAIQLIINPDIPGLDVSTEYVIHNENLADASVLPGDVIVSKSSLFEESASFCNVGSNSCTPKPFALTLGEGHGLSSDFDIADIIALKNLSNASGINGNNIVSKATAGANIFVMPPDSQPIRERVSFFEAYNISSNESLSSCDPAQGNLSSCNFSALATHVSTLDFSEVSSALVNKNPPSAVNFNIAQSSAVVNGLPVFGGERLPISSSTPSNIGFYFQESQSSFSGFELFKFRRLCEMINLPCSSVSGESSGSIEGNGYFKRIISVANSSGSNADQITIRATLNTQTLITAGKMSSDCSDIRIYGGSTKFNHWVADNTCNTSTTDIYILIPLLQSGGIDLTMYYGDIGLTNESNGVSTFPIFFEDFSRGTLGSHPQSHVSTSYDPTNFGGTAGNSNYTVSGGYFNQNGGSGYTGSGKADITLDSNLTHGNFIITTKFIYTSVGNGLMHGGGVLLRNQGVNNWNGPFHYSTGYNYHNYTYLNGSGAWLSGTGGVTTGINYMADIEFTPSKVWEKCFRNCTWNRGRTGTTGLSTSSISLNFGGGYSGYVSKYDYVLYRRIPSNGDPTVTVGSEQSDP